VPDSRTQRGPHPRDRAAFEPKALPDLRAAVSDLSLLLSRGYSARAATKLVGDRYRLRERQRKALQRCAAADTEIERRRQHRIDPEELAGETVLIDGYNVLLTVEAALSGGVLLLARDGALRDLAQLSRHYRRVATTVPALDEIGGWLSRWRVAEVLWLIDRPISNSARLRGIIEERAREHGWPWEVELSANVDRHLCRAEEIVATADSAILDRCERWLNLARHVVEDRTAGAWIVEL
jgi:hypothetical protein